MNVIKKIRATGPLQYIFGQLGLKQPESLRAQQESIDISRAAVLLKGYKWFQDNYELENNKKVYGTPDPNVIARFFDNVDEMEPKAMNNLVQKSIELQVIDMFKKLDKHLSPDEPIKERHHADQPAPVSLSDSIGFELSVRTSTIYRAGDVSGRNRRMKRIQLLSSDLT